MGQGKLTVCLKHSDKNGVRLTKHIINPLDPKETDSPLAFWEVNLPYMDVCTDTFYFELNKLK